jgi:hypothetical protein
MSGAKQSIDDSLMPASHVVCFLGQPQPCKGPRQMAFRISMSSVPCRRPSCLSTAPLLDVLGVGKRGRPSRGQHRRPSRSGSSDLPGRAANAVGSETATNCPVCRQVHPIERRTDRSGRLVEGWFETEPAERPYTTTVGYQMPPTGDYSGIP